LLGRRLFAGGDVAGLAVESDEMTGDREVLEE